MGQFHIALLTPFTDQSDPPGAVAAAAERYGFDMLCMGEHPFFPVRMNTPYPSGGEPPRWYQSIADLFVVMAMAAQATTRLRVGSTVCLVPERNPILLAKAAATLDYFSAGRLTLGVGTGWVREEYEILGADFDHRWQVMGECVAAMKEMWTKPEAEFHGRWVSFPAIRVNPKPAQKPHPPVIVCAGQAARYNRSLRYTVSVGDGWMPLFYDAGQQLAQFAEAVVSLRRMCEEAGRDFTQLQIIPAILSAVEGGADLVRRYRDAGASGVALMTPGQIRQGRTDDVLGPIANRFVGRFD
ncbi:MAG TPA: TIGR03619 family F420-dependent LLM class oxidoreductase [Candidatus Binataceae bacterium]|jgi:probable F420-dependent oxidoreductase|nr:TIGR03619 family F420-dependent LLM class oxidoreductase [Candidatus Binataceae bacterium]